MARGLDSSLVRYPGCSTWPLGYCEEGKQLLRVIYGRVQSTNLSRMYITNRLTFHAEPSLFGRQIATIVSRICSKQSFLSLTTIQSHDGVWTTEALSSPREPPILRSFILLCCQIVFVDLAKSLSFSYHSLVDESHRRLDRP
jgi:hypothetical protein